MIQIAQHGVTKKLFLFLSANPTIPNVADNKKQPDNHQIIEDGRCSINDKPDTINDGGGNTDGSQAEVIDII